MEATPQSARNTTNLTLATVLLLISGVVSVAGSAFGWARVLYPTLAGPAREAVGHGHAALFLGLFLLLSGIVALAVRSREVKRAWLSVGIACGVALGVLAVFDFITLRGNTIDHLTRISATDGVDPGQVARLILFSFRLGIFAAMVSGGVALAAAVFLFLGRAGPERPQAPEPATRANDQS